MDFKRLVQVIDQMIAAYDLSVIRRQDKDFNFDDVYPLLQEAFSLLELLKDQQRFWELLPQGGRTNGANQLIALNDWLKAAKEFDPHAIGNPGERRNTIAAQIRNQYEGLYHNVFQPLKTYMAGRGAQEQADILQKLLAEARADLDKIRVQNEQAKQTVLAIKHASGTAGSSVFTKVFANQASDHFNAAMWWLVISLLASGGVAVFIFFILEAFLTAIKDADKLHEVLQAFLAKAFIVSFLSYVVYQLFKNYNAHMHLHVTNKHRENCLRSFESFAKATTDEKMKDKILLQATKAIFDHGHTGYISSKDGNVTDIEIVKNIASSS